MIVVAHQTVSEPQTDVAKDVPANIPKKTNHARDHDARVKASLDQPKHSKNNDRRSGSDKT